MTNPLQDRAERVMKLARKHGDTLVTVESCTAGSLVNLLSDMEGASETLHGGFVVYTKANKTAAVGVPEQLLKTHTAVNGEIAKAMATGALDRCPATLAVAIAGVAGPEPDADGNPVGLVFVAAAARDGRVEVERHEFGIAPKHEICGGARMAALALVETLLARLQTSSGLRGGSPVTRAACA